MFKGFYNILDVLIMTVKLCFGPHEVGSDCKMFFYGLKHDELNGKYFFTQHEGSNE